MQVSNIAELDTHAVIGGGSAQAFGMSDSAEFFTILSDTLYRDKKRAVIREVVCNAWDAHIMVGKTDQPVEITLTDDELIIKDFGPGISDKRIVPIYCVYGGSTKARDDSQTGGFGLGSKAPFAYSDHFSVTSAHGGHRTVYAISRGGSETDGKPDIRAMVRTKSDETGITVSIPLKTPNDKDVFAEVIRSVVMQGGMLAKLNGDVLNRINYEPARKIGFCAVHDNLDLSESVVYVLYGTVLYPVTTTDQDLMAKVQATRHLVPSGYRLVLLAEPGSIGVTPSREALSYSEKTNKTIIDLLDRADRRLRQPRAEALNRLAAEKLKESDRMGISAHFDDKNSPAPKQMPVIHDVMEIAKRSVRQNVNYDYDKASKAVAKAAMKRFRDSRRQFRRIAGMAYHYVNFEVERSNHSSRLFLRLASKLGLLNALYVRDSREYSSRLSHIEGVGSYNAYSDELIVTPTVKAANAYIKENYDHDSYYSDKHKRFNGAVLVIPRSTPELRDQIKALAGKYKLQSTELEFAKPKRRAALKKTEGIFYDLAKFNASKKKFANPEPTLDQASVYLRLSGYAEKVKTFYGMNEKLRDELLAVFPTIAVSLNIKQETKLRMKGAVNVAEALAAEIRKYAKFPDVQYAYMANNQLFISDDNNRWYGPAYRAKNLMSSNLDFARFLFPTRIRFTDRSKKVFECMRLLDEMTYDETAKKLRVELQKEIKDKAMKTFAASIINSDEAEKRFAYLKPFSHTIDSSSCSVGLMKDLMVFLRRREHQSTLINKAGEERKEAA